MGSDEFQDSKTVSVTSAEVSELVEEIEVVIIGGETIAEEIAPVEVLKEGGCFTFGGIERASPNVPQSGTHRGVPTADNLCRCRIDANMVLVRCHPGRDPARNRQPRIFRVF
jgi:hypothetical protein